MTAIVVHLRRCEQRRIQRLMRITREAGIRSRALIVLHAAAGKSTGYIADALGYDPSAVVKVLHRFVAEGEDGLRDHREDNGHAKVDDAMWGSLATLLAGSPEDYGWARPTWTQELLARQLAHDSGVRVSDSTVGRMLAALGARWGMARPTVACPLGSRAQAAGCGRSRGAWPRCRRAKKPCTRMKWTSISIRGSGVTGCCLATRRPC